MTRGVAAAGHPLTAEAAAEMLRAGGNAFDAVLAGLWAATVTEPVLASLGGGGFLLAEPAGGAAKVYDFFVQTPMVKKDPAALEFQSLHATFAGGVTQEFHAGLGAVATPGMVPGLFAIHRDLATLPMTDIAAPAVALARDGLQVNRFQAYLATVVAPMLSYSQEGRRIYGAESGDGLMREGDWHRQSELADTIASLSETGCLEGFAAEIAEVMTKGGHLTAPDVTDYQVTVRDPITIVLPSGGKVLLNAPPSAGGPLVGFGLELLKHQEMGAFGSAPHVGALVAALDATVQARAEKGATAHLLAAEFLDRYRQGVRPLAVQGTTHISVIDADGNAASATMSNGSTSGRLLPGRGVMLNNMLGEEDLCPDGFHNWPTDVRVSSMMCPALLDLPNGQRVALGSGGSNRIRSAVLQTIANMALLGMDVSTAVAAPRMHLENGKLDIEPGFERAILDSLAGSQSRWTVKDMYFGGVHAVTLDRGTGTLSGAGDPRRDGAVAYG